MSFLSVDGYLLTINTLLVVIRITLPPLTFVFTSNGMSTPL